MSAATTAPPPPGVLDPGQPVSPRIAAARAQFLSDFAGLMAHLAAHPGDRWVAYHGPDRVGVGATKAELVRLCLGLGFPVGDFLVLGIDPATADPNG